MDRQQSWLGIRTPQLIVIYYQFLWKQTYQLGQAGYTYTAYKSDNTEKNPLSDGTYFTPLVEQFPQKPLNRMKAKSVDSECHI